MTGRRRAPGSVRLAVVGAGAWAEFAHLPGFLRRPEVLPWVISRRDPDKLQRIRGRFDFAHATTDWREAIGMGADVVDVTGPGALRGTQAIPALDAGSHVLAEKPFTIDPAEAWAVEALARERGRHVVLCYAWNEMGIVEHARGLIGGEDGIGEVEHISVSIATIVRNLLTAARRTSARPTSPLLRAGRGAIPRIWGAGTDRRS